LAVEQMPSAIPRSIAYCRFPIMDGQQSSQAFLRTAIETAVCLLRQGVPTLICCSAGMSRSPAIAAGAMSIAYGGTPDDRLREIVMGHPHDVSPQLWNDVRQLCAGGRSGPLSAPGFCITR
jgi:protein-tyrosine phosphatase